MGDASTLKHACATPTGLEANGMVTDQPAQDLGASLPEPPPAKQTVETITGLAFVDYLSYFDIHVSPCCTCVLLVNALPP